MTEYYPSQVPLVVHNDSAEPLKISVSHSSSDWTTLSFRSRSPNRIHISRPYPHNPADSDRISERSRSPSPDPDSDRNAERPKSPSLDPDSDQNSERPRSPSHDYDHGDSVAEHNTRTPRPRSPLYVRASRTSSPDSYYEGYYRTRTPRPRSPPHVQAPSLVSDYEGHVVRIQMPRPRSPPYFQTPRASSPDFRRSRTDSLLSVPIPVPQLSYMPQPYVPVYAPLPVRRADSPDSDHLRRGRAYTPDSALPRKSTLKSRANSVEFARAPRRRAATPDSIRAPRKRADSLISLNLDYERPFEPWDIRYSDSGLKYAPDRPGGDSLKMLLEPHIKNDRAQCEVWKDEVQNLLIFAGLFSAVVTTFVVQSYQALQPGPEDTMVALLSQIATRLDNTTASTSQSPATFVQDPQSVRINSFWFVSLVLSLTTVLVGIISLQWLREHQAYPDVTSYEEYAIFRMRLEGLKKWHVPKVFTALPLLLQGALVLFLVGMADFSRTLGNGVAIPVTIAISLTLLFLLGTTALPTLQGFTLYFLNNSSNAPLTVPTQCPYKSPQSRAFRIMARLVFNMVDFLYKEVGMLQSVGPRYIHQRFRSNIQFQVPKVNPVRHFLPDVWRRGTWIQFDRGWLKLRDECAQETFYRSKGIQNHSLDSTAFPIYDVALGLAESDYFDPSQNQEEYSACVYSSLCDILGSVGHQLGDDTNADRADHHTQYYQAIASPNSNDHGTLLETFNFYSGDRSNHTEDSTLQSTLLWLENISIFLDQNTDIFPPMMHGQLSFEVKIRIMRWVFGHHDKLSLKSPAPISSTAWPGCLTVYLEDVKQCIDISAMEENYGRAHEFYWQYGDVIAHFFEHIRFEGETDWSVNARVGKGVPGLLQEAALITDFVINGSGERYPDQTTTKIYEKILSNITDRLSLFVKQSGQVKGSAGANLLFYTGTLFIRPLVVSPPPPARFTWAPNTYAELEKALPVLNQYKTQFLAVYGPDTLLEARFAGDNEGIARFSGDWWAFLDTPVPLKRLKRLTDGPISVAVEMTEPKEAYPITGIEQERARYPEIVGVPDIIVDEITDSSSERHSLAGVDDEKNTRPPNNVIPASEDMEVVLPITPKYISVPEEMISRNPEDHETMRGPQTSLVEGQFTQPDNAQTILPPDGTTEYFRNPDADKLV